MARHKKRGFNKGRKNLRKGFKHIEVTKKRMSLSHTGLEDSDETKIKKAIAQLKNKNAFKNKDILKSKIFPTDLLREWGYQWHIYDNAITSIKSNPKWLKTHHLLLIDFIIARRENEKLLVWIKDKQEELEANNIISTDEFYPKKQIILDATKRNEYYNKEKRKIIKTKDKILPINESIIQYENSILFGRNPLQLLLYFEKKGWWDWV